ncbi:MAG: EVE domain-containing protein [Alphaproteobacteria bacterium]
MAYWIMKSEPETYAWAEMVRDKRTHWDGVRNYQASNNMKAMKKGDRAFFYHSGKERRIVGVVEVVREYYPDHTDESGRFGMVDVKALMALDTPVALSDIKADEKLGGIALVRQSRLSVSPLDARSWKRICRMGGIDA